MDFLINAGVGQWQLLKACSAIAHVKKFRDETEVRVKIPSVKKQATFKVKDNSGSEAVGGCSCSRNDRTVSSTPPYLRHLGYHHVQ